MQKLRSEVQIIKLAFGYLTRFDCGRIATSPEMGQALCWLPFIGLILGIIATLPFSLFHFFSNNVLVQAWTYVCLLLWLTRAMHMDGFADLLDALGSGKKGPDFFAVLKDSRIGVFGATGIGLILSGLIFLCYSLLLLKQVAPLIIAPMLARTLPLLLSRCTPLHPCASLGKLIVLIPPQKSMIILLGALSITFFSFSLLAFILSCLFCAALTLYTRSIAKRNGGYNGDYLGFLITLGEISILLAYLLAM